MYSKYKDQEPALCFRYEKETSFIMRDEDDSSSLFVYNNTHLHEYRFRLNYDLLAYDCVTENLFLYDSDYLYRIDVGWLVHKIMSDSEKIYMSMKPTIKTVFENWTDMLVVEDTLYFLNDKEMYIIIAGREHMLGFYGSDKFNHTLVPTFEHFNGIREFENDEPQDVLLKPVEDTVPQIVRVEYEDVKRAKSFPEIVISEPNTRSLAIFISIVFVFQMCVLVCYICDYSRRRNYQVVRPQ
jgi:hypothetical protein